MDWKTYARASLPDRLAQLQGAGLTDDLIVDILERALGMANELNEFYPSNARGQELYLHAIGGLCETATSEHGWQHTEVKGQKRAVSPSGLAQLAIVTCDARTGTPGGVGPQPKKGRGEVTCRTVCDATLMLPGVAVDFDPAAFRQESAVDYWLLSIHLAQDELRWELGRPNRISKNGAKIDWAFRHIGPPIMPFEPDEESSGDTPPAIDVPVRRK